MCADKEKYDIWGDYNSNKANQFIVSFYRCVEPEPEEGEVLEP